MSIFLIIIFICILILGLIGCFIPVIPGPPLVYLSILLLSFFTPFKLSDTFLLNWAGIVILVTFFDFWLQVYGVKKFGGQKKAINGAIFGLVAGLIAPIPFGFIIGPFLGAFLGASIEEKDFIKIIKISLGALVGFLGGTILKLLVSIYLAYEFFKILIYG